MSDTTHFSGNFAGAIVNYKSTLTQVTQSIQTVPGSAAEKQELERLVLELQAALDTLPPAQKDIAEAIATQTHNLVEEAKKPAPNKALLGITADGLKNAAASIADITPKVLSAATQIAAFFSKFGS
ncbi:MAG: hypothetical protein HQ483_02495 [Rhodospirillales bacterium]|nr:hypothetical protein [Rhodospirillales bacterium]